MARKPICLIMLLTTQVVVNKPVPCVQAKDGGAFEDTMLLLEMVRDKKQQEMKQIKVRIIYHHIMNSNS